MSKTHKSPHVLETEILIEKFIPGGRTIGKITSAPIISAINTFAPTDSSSTSSASSSFSSNPSLIGKKVLLWNALPGETVTKFQITKQKSSFLEGIALEFKNSSPFRVPPKDLCFLSTSPWQILTYSYELEQKRLLVEESLCEAHISLPKSLKISSVQTDNIEWNYRNKMEYALYWDKEQEKIFLAFHARGSHQKLPLSPNFSPKTPLSPSLSPVAPKPSSYGSSSLEHEEILKKAQEIVDDLNNRHESAFKYQSLLLRSNQQGIISGGLFENKKPHPTFNNLSDSLLNHSYSYSPNGFFQINLPVYELALKEIKKHIKTEKVLDLYSGVGTIGLSVARDKILTLVECNESAYGELLKNCQFVLSSNTSTSAQITPVLAKSEEALSYIEPDQTVILDPPRAGCDSKLITQLLEILPETIIYLSCNPSTQARDIALLTKEGNYNISQITPFNFFPKTPHIENLIILNKN